MTDNIVSDSDSADREYLGAKAVATWTGIPEGTLRFWRHAGKGQGPRSAKFGRRIVYRRADVEAWISEQFEKSAG